MLYCVEKICCCIGWGDEFIVSWAAGSQDVSWVPARPVKEVCRNHVVVPSSVLCTFALHLMWIVRPIVYIYTLCSVLTHVSWSGELDTCPHWLRIVQGWHIEAIRNQTDQRCRQWCIHSHGSLNLLQWTSKETFNLQEIICLRVHLLISHYARHCIFLQHRITSLLCDVWTRVTV